MPLFIYYSLQAIQAMRILFVMALTLISIGLSAAQDLTITGRVLDKNTKSPLPGVSVFVPELNRGVVTDLDGNFTITSLPEKNITFQISFIGYST
jgi:iron complex outermembrane recepter protein